MSDCVAIVGSREGANLDHVEGFVADLWRKFPDTTLISGGAPGVDQAAEKCWLEFGGKVKSLRPVKIDTLANGDESWGIECWELGGDAPRMYRLVNELTFGNFQSAAIYRDILIAEAADRVVSFMRSGGSRGAGFTAEMAEFAYEKPTYRYVAERAV